MAVIDKAMMRKFLRQDLNDLTREGIDRQAINGIFEEAWLQYELDPVSFGQLTTEDAVQQAKLAYIVKQAQKLKDEELEQALDEPDIEALFRTEEQREQAEPANNLKRQAIKDELERRQQRANKQEGWGAW